MHTGFLPICDGRTVFVFKQDRTMPVAANYPVQGAAASVMYRAVTRCPQSAMGQPAAVPHGGDRA